MADRGAGRGSGILGRFASRRCSRVAAATMPRMQPPSSVARQPSRAGPASSPRSTWARTASGSRSARSSDGRYRRIDYLKETVRLGAGLDAAGFLNEEAATRGLDCLARFARRLDGFAPHQVRAVATQTLREAQQPRRLPAARADRPRPADRDHLRPRGGAPHLRRRRAAAAVDGAAPGHRHRRPLDRDDPRPRHAAAPGRVVPGRQRQPVDEVLRRRPLQRARASARRRSPPAPSSRKRSSRSRRATGARRSARRAPSARSRRCSPRAASATAASRPAGLRWLMERCLEAGSADRLDAARPEGRSPRRHRRRPAPSSTRWPRTSASPS